MGASTNQHTFQAPTGTRDLYPAELNRLRYIQKAWRETSIRHGFEEIDGPTFEHLDLYTVKSGEGIVSELFQTFSGKDEGEIARIRSGASAPYALRPEFTPTLARMYAAKANALPKPTKWFWMQNCFRAERPQRGRLREFAQWNVDLIGDASVGADAEVLAIVVDMLRSVGLTSEHIRIKISHRDAVRRLLLGLGVVESTLSAAFALLDRRDKLPRDAFLAQASSLGLDAPAVNRFEAVARMCVRPGQSGPDFRTETGMSPEAMTSLQDLNSELQRFGLLGWYEFDLGIVRGLAYYTGMVFEVHEATGAERAIAGGGRYDELIETFGGPPTPAVGFGMGDVVLSLVLQDKGLMPKDEEIAERLGMRPDVFVIGRGSEAADAAVGPLVARLRREGLHARRSYKATKNVGKLLKDAAGCGARVVAFVEADGAGVTLERLADGAKEQVAGIGAVGEAVRRLGAGSSAPSGR